MSGQSKAKFLEGLFAASSFPVPTLGKEGNIGRNTYDEPGYNDFNFTVDKFFNVPWFFSEKMKVEMIGEIYNAFNRSNLYSVSSDLSTNTFGTATNQLPLRSFQMHLRASF